MRKVVFGFFIFFLLVAGVLRASYFRVYANFHEVDPGKFYRSAQLTADELTEVVKQYGIKTVINLRGEQVKKDWYQWEKGALDPLGVKLYSLDYRTEYVPHKAELVKYLDILEKAERPILVHCRQGTDRTGEASAIYKMEYMGASKQEALNQLSLYYLHVNLFQPSKIFFVENYGGRAWAQNTYDPCDEKFKPYYQADRCPN